MTQTVSIAKSWHPLDLGPAHRDFVFAVMPADAPLAGAPFMAHDRIDNILAGAQPPMDCLKQMSPTVVLPDPPVSDLEPIAHPFRDRVACRGAATAIPTGPQGRE
jgi:hypothetical protein